YDLFWGGRPQPPSPLAHVVDTFNGIGGIVGQKRTYYSSRFVVDFAGEVFARLDDDAAVEAQIKASAGRIEITSARPLHSIDGYRAMFDIVPSAASEEPINIELYLTVENRPISETWVYQWTPPPADER